MKSLKDLELFSGSIPSAEGGKMMERGYLFKPETPPYLVYLILKEHFGVPNSFDYDEDKTQWLYLFTYNNFYVEIYDWKIMETSIAIFHPNVEVQKCEALASQIDQLISKLAVAKQGKLKEKRKSSKKRLLENPFFTYYDTAISHWELIEKFNELRKSQPRLYLDLGLSQRENDLCRSAFIMFMSAFEGFINILYEIYLKPELREKRITDRLARELIDVKIRMAPVYCGGFKEKTINHEDDRFRNYLRLINLRNDYIHANLIRALESYVIEEDNMTFLIENEDNSQIPSNISQLQPEHVKLCRKYIDDMIVLIFESMTQKSKREFKKVAFAYSISIEEEEGEYIPHNPYTD
jgi:hypothetical protein